MQHMKKLMLWVLPLTALFCSCSGKPSEKEITEKILMEYICADKAKVDGLKILNTEETKNLIGKPAYRYAVTGEVEWPEGCTEFGSRLEPGRKESFEKTVTLSKGDDGEWH